MPYPMLDPESAPAPRSRAITVGLWPWVMEAACGGGSGAVWELQESVR